MSTIDDTKIEATIDDLKNMLGEQMGRSDVLELTQDRVTAFGGVTLDFDPHHIDPTQAEKGPFGGAAAQGFLTLSLLTYFISTSRMKVDIKQHINYGLNKVRFIKPAMVGEHLQAVFTLQGVDERKPGAPILSFRVEVLSKEQDAPVMVAEWLAMVIV
ncbi:MAG: MaoC/PaaZ C-terminal domain-containing protein [Pseudomonadota bacterium]